MALRPTRREFIWTAATASAALSIPFVRRRFARASEIDPAAIKKLGASFQGKLIVPGDAEYESARRIWNWRYDKHPAMIARCAGTDDVVRCVEFARKSSLIVSIRSGGHDTCWQRCPPGVPVGTKPQTKPVPAIWN